MLAYEIDVFINLIADDIDLWMFPEHFCECNQLIFAVDSAGRVAGEENINTFVFGVMAASSCAAVILKPLSSEVWASTTVALAIFTSSE